MSPSTFACPECRTPLRLRERRFIGTTFPCPECQTALTLLEALNAEVFIRKAADVSPVPPVPEVPPTRPVSIRTWKIPEWCTSPVTVSWVVAISVAAVLITLALRSQPTVIVPPPLSPIDQANNDHERPPEDVEAAITWLATTSDTAEDRWQKFGLRLNQYVTQYQQFPPGTMAGPTSTPDQFSWLADLERNQPRADATKTPFDSQKAWRDPANERFVRRQVAEFLRPDITITVGDQGYPTTHFVGSGGLGRDGPTLPVTHPRAGLFGYGRTTRPDDVVDGLSQTLAVVGSENGYGSWAEGGPATVRPFTAEPYIHGPDGFGTGAGESMAVLMADGSVRTVSAATDPRLFRRMVAIADRLPLDATVPGEPGDQPALPVPSAPVNLPHGLAVNPPDEPPISALTWQNQAPTVVARVLPDWDSVLQQRLLRFELTKAVPRETLLQELEDLLGRQIVWQADDLGPSLPLLRQPIQLQLQDVTVMELLEKILEQTGLTYRLEGDQVRLQRVSTAASAP